MRRDSGILPRRAWAPIAGALLIDQDQAWTNPMSAFLSVWMGLTCLVMSIVMVAYPPAVTEWTLILFLELLAPLTLCLAGIVLWSYRKDRSNDPPIAAQRLQAKIAITLTLIACALVYFIFFGPGNRATG